MMAEEGMLSASQRNRPGVAEPGGQGVQLLPVGRSLNNFMFRFPHRQNKNINATSQGLGELKEITNWRLWLG